MKNRIKTFMLCALLVVGFGTIATDADSSSQPTIRLAITDLVNDVLIAGKHVDAAMIESFRSVFHEYSHELIDAILQGDDNQKYRGMQFLTGVKDSDYNDVREMYATIGFPQFSEFVGD